MSLAFEIEHDLKKDDSSAVEAGQASEHKTRANTALVTDPDPRSRVRWQRKKVIQMVRKGGQLTRDERIAMTERTMTHKSEWMPTSTKKLVMLARQVAGKNVDDAIAQMQWSKKKFAAEVKYHLEEARDLAVAQRGIEDGEPVAGHSGFLLSTFVSARVATSPIYSYLVKISPTYAAP